MSDISTIGVAAVDKTTGAILATSTNAWLDSRYVGKPPASANVLFVSTAGDDGNDGRNVSSAKATLGAALSAMGTAVGTIVLGVGSFATGGGVVWPTGARCGLVGQGASRTTITASNQSGHPVLDLTAPGYSLDGVEIGGFAVVGDGVAGSGNKGVVFSSALANSRLYVHDIYVSNTGGACFDLGAAEICDFVRLYAKEPVNAGSADIPYVMATGAFNGNTIDGLQLYGVSAGANVGASGAIIVKDNGTYPPSGNHFRTLKCENLHLASGATILALAGNTNIISDSGYWDCAKVTGATGTSHMRLTGPGGGGNQGGNVVRGVIPGKGTGANDIDMGIDMQQGRNRVEGTKGYRGTNVVIAAGVNFTSVALGAANNGATDPAVVDNSGVFTNTVTDDFSNLTIRPARTYQLGAAKMIMDVPGGVIAGGPRFYDTTTPANGAVGVGTSGVRMLATGTAMFLGADQVSVRKLDNTPGAIVLGTSLSTNTSIRTGSGSPETVVTAGVGSIYLRTDGGAGTTLYVKESGTGNTGWIAK